jgi:hypothetical protein
MPAQDLATLIEEIRKLRFDFDALDRDLKRFKVFGKTGEVDDLKERIEILESSIASLCGKKPGVKQKNRTDILRALLAANNGKMFESDARKTMGLDKATFSRLLATLGDVIEVKPFSANKRRNLLILRSENG